MGQIRRGESKVPLLCGLCEHCKPYRVPLPHGSGMYGGFIAQGSYCVRFFCSFDHHSAVDSRGVGTAVTPSEPPPLKPDGSPFCPIAKGWYDTHAVSKTSTISMSGAEHTETAEAPHLAAKAVEMFDVVGGWREVPTSYFYKYPEAVTRAGQGEPIRVVNDAGGVLVEFSACAPEQDKAQSETPDETPEEASQSPD